MCQGADLKSILDDFIGSNEFDVVTLLGKSKSYLTEAEEASVFSEFVRRYQEIKGGLKGICGAPIARDVFGFTFSEFTLSENEKLASMLTLFSYEDCRFGVLLYQEGEGQPLEIRLSACRPSRLPAKPSLTEELKGFINKFVGSHRAECHKVLKYSGVFFAEDEEEFDNSGEGETLWEYTYKEFKDEYEKAVSLLKEICGAPLVENVSAWEFEGFPLAECESMADELTLFSYKGCRFGVLLHQEDKELPLELWLSACRPDRL
ncbi:hypothetical protein D3C76_279310 [compost metagenome]